MPLPCNNESYHSFFERVNNYETTAESLDEERLGSDSS